MDYKKKLKAYFSCFVLLGLIISGCSNSDENDEDNEAITISTDDHYEYDENDYYTNYENEEYTKVNLNEEDGNVTIKSAGTYVLNGNLENGSIIVNVGDNDVVRLVLLDATIHCDNSAPIYVENAEKVIISLPEGSENTISDGSNYVLDADNEPSAAIFSKDDLTLNGAGSLIVNANYNNAIQSKDTLKIMEGNYTINATNDAIKGKDALIIRAGNFKITSLGDGLCTTNETEKGELIIENGVFDINATFDGIQSKGTLTIYDGNFKITSGGGSINAVSTNASSFGEFDDYDDVNENSTKGIKSEKDMILENGTFNVSSTDDAIHCGGNIIIKDGDYTLSSDDDGIHSDYDLTIANATINILQSYEGLEGAIITIDSGNISLVASDDGINAASDMSSTWQLNINGGSIYVDANGDGVDSNGGISMNDGMLIIMGSSNDANGALDYDGTFDINGGTMIAVGTSGMAMTPSNSSTQCSMMVALNATQSSGTTLYISDSNGNVIAGITPVKNYSNVVISSANLIQQETYTIYSGGSLSDTINGYSINASGGTQLGTITLNGINTTYGNAGMGGNPGGQGGMMQQGRP